jgi:hypothetical protein
MIDYDNDFIYKHDWKLFIFIFACVAIFGVIVTNVLYEVFK